MSIWDTVGSLLGLAADDAREVSFAEWHARRRPLDPPPPGPGEDLWADEAQRREAFVAAIVGLGAKMAKADGSVSRPEVDAFKRAFKIPAEDYTVVGRLFDDAKHTIDGFEDAARQVAYLMGYRQQLLEEVLDGLFSIALADGDTLTSKKEWFLHRVATIFALLPNDWQRVRANHGGGGGFGKRRREDQPRRHGPPPPGPPPPGPNDPYRVLGVSPSTSDEDIKTAYRQLLRANHPDVLIGQGASEEAIAAGSRKVAAINAAWDEIDHLRRAASASASS